MLTHRAPHAGYGGASGRTGRHAHGSPDCACCFRSAAHDFDGVWLLGQGRAASRKHGRLRPWPLPPPPYSPTIGVGTCSWKVSPDASARTANILSGLRQESALVRLLRVRVSLLKCSQAQTWWSYEAQVRGCVVWWQS